MYSGARKIKRQNSVGSVASRLEVKWASLNEVTVDKRELDTQVEEMNAQKLKRQRFHKDYSLGLAERTRRKHSQHNYIAARNEEKKG